MNTFLARTGSNFLAIKQSLPCGCVQFRGRALAPPPPRSAFAVLWDSFKKRIYCPCTKLHRPCTKAYLVQHLLTLPFLPRILIKTAESAFKMCII